MGAAAQVPAEQGGSKPIKLKPRHRRFVNEYLKDFNVTGAARRAGYSPRSAGDTGFAILRTPAVRAEVDRLRDMALAGQGYSPERVLQAAGHIAFADLRKCFDENGNMRPLSELDDATASALASVKVLERKSTTKKVKDVDGDAPDGENDQLVAEVEQIRELKLWDKPRALELLAKAYRLTNERLEVNVKTDLADLLREVVRRNEAKGMVPGKGKVEALAPPADPKT